MADPFANFDAYEPSLKRALYEARAFVTACQRQKEERDTHRPDECVLGARWLTLSGVCGCGKTTLARMAFNAASEFNPGNSALWVHSGDEYRERTRRPLNVWMHADTFAARLMGGEFDLPETLGQDYLVVIDDIGASKDTANAFIASKLSRLAEVRLGKWTIFTTNLTHAEVAAQIDPRVASRMIRDGNIAIRITTPDFAERKGKK
jgi:DNA replication protein DnaC